MIADPGRPIAQSGSRRYGPDRGWFPTGPAIFSMSVPPGAWSILGRCSREGQTRRAWPAPHVVSGAVASAVAVCQLVVVLRLPAVRGQLLAPLELDRLGDRLGH